MKASRGARAEYHSLPFSGLFASRGNSVKRRMQRSVGCSHVDESIARNRTSERHRRRVPTAALPFFAIPLWFLKTSCAEIIFDDVAVCGDSRSLWQ
jgi:hypothetical protein